MYICVCNAVKEHEMLDLARQYPGDSVEQLYARLGVEVNCGSCLSFADGLVGQVRVADMSATIVGPASLKDPARPEAHSVA